MIKGPFNIEENKRKILSDLSKIERPGMTNVIGYLENSDYFTAPASSKFHNNCEGGLAAHGLNLKTLLTEKNERFNLGLSEASICIAAYLHDICKVNVYKSTTKNVLVGKKPGPYGKMINDWRTQSSYEFQENLPLGHGEKSLTILQYKGLHLEAAEMFMIRWHMGAFDLSPSQMRTFGEAQKFIPAVTAMCTADMEATAYLENIYEGDLFD